MKIFAIMAFTCLLIAGGVLAYIFFDGHPLYSRVSPFEILDKEDMDEDMRYANNYLIKELVEPLQRYNDDSLSYNEEGPLFSRAYIPQKMTYDLLALKSGGDGEEFYLTAKYSDRGYAGFRYSFRLKFLSDGDMVYALNKDNESWVFLEEHPVFSNVLYTLWNDEHSREDYFSDKLLNPKKYADQLKERSLEGGENILITFSER